MTKEVNASHILVKGEPKAKELMERIKKGESFSKLAMEYSECPSRKRGGELGWFTRGKMVREFENAAFSGEKGAILGPIKTQFGWHIIKIINKK